LTPTQKFTIDLAFVSVCADRPPRYRTRRWREGIDTGEIGRGLDPTARQVGA
jgi:hypothetical protein